MKEVEVPDAMYVCFVCNEVIEEDDFLIEKSDKVENNKYVEVIKFFHEDCGDSVAGTEASTKIRSPN